MTSAAVRVAAVIPARMRSSRFPGKPLVAFRGLPMIEHVRRRALLSEVFSEVVVATCDREIVEVVERAGGRAMMTSPDHPGATDRVAEAVTHLDCTHVVNVQGDELLVPPDDLRRMVQQIAEHPDVPAWNAVGPIESDDELTDHAVVKLFLSRHDRVIFCARRVESGPVAGPAYEPVRKSIGVMGYTRDFVQTFVRLPRTPLERATGIDQLRLVELDIPLQAVQCARGYPKIDEPREVALVEACFEEDAAQRAVLEQLRSPVAQPVTGSH